MGIKTYYNAAICATYDRRDVRNMSEKFYHQLKKVI